MHIGWVRSANGDTGAVKAAYAGAKREKNQLAGIVWTTRGAKILGVHTLDGV
jgi:hypothetical protein